MIWFRSTGSSISVPPNHRFFSLSVLFFMYSSIQKSETTMKGEKNWCIILKIMPKILPLAVWYCYINFVLFDKTCILLFLNVKLNLSPHVLQCRLKKNFLVSCQSFTLSLEIHSWQVYDNVIGHTCLSGTDYKSGFLLSVMLANCGCLWTHFYSEQGN